MRLFYQPINQLRWGVKPTNDRVLTPSSCCIKTTATKRFNTLRRIVLDCSKCASGGSTTLNWKGQTYSISLRRRQSGLGVSRHLWYVAPFLFIHCNCLFDTLVHWLSENCTRVFKITYICAFRKSTLYHSDVKHICHLIDRKKHQ